MFEDLKSQRRKPKQARARATSNAIFEAATQILENEGEAAFNTNRIAERAGVSVGTLYQYFDSKERILIEMAEQEMLKFRARCSAIGRRTDDPALASRLAIRAFIQGFRGRPATRRAAISALEKVEPKDKLGREIDLTSYLLPAPETASRVDAFILTRAVIGIVRAAVLEDFPALYTKEFEDGLVRLVQGYRRAE